MPSLGAAPWPFGERNVFPVMVLSDIGPREGTGPSPTASVAAASHGGRQILGYPPHVSDREDAPSSRRGDVIDHDDALPSAPHTGAPPRARAPLLTVVALIGLAVVAWLPRGLALDRAVTPDESIWLARSGNFYQALVDGDLAHTYQYAHPGVTTIWAGAIAYRVELPEYADFGPDALRPWNNTILPVLREGGADPLRLLVAARGVMVIFSTLGILGVGWYATRLFGLGPGLVGSLLLALDPFHAALSQLLHVDALASVLTTLAAVAWLTYLLHGRRRGDLAVAGVALGLAGLTRSSAMVVVPMMAASLLLVRGQGGHVGDGVRSVLNRFRPLAAVGVVAVATVVLGWPAMSVDPASTVRKVVVGTLHLSEEPHDRPIFFDGRVFDGVDPGVRFYPTALLWRTTPALLVGLLLAAAVGLAAATALARRRAALDARAQAACLLAGLAVLALALLSASDKKLDRYVVLAVPPLALVAGWGYGAAGRAVGGWLSARRVRLPRLATAMPALLLLALTAAEARAVHPYPLSYYDPLLGGADGARDTMMIGAGEGFDQIAHALDALPGAAEQRIVTSAWEAPIAFFTRTAAVELVNLNTPTGIGTWLEADYYVWDITSDQRGAVPPVILEHIAGLTPLTTVRLNGVVYAAIYDVRAGGIPAPLAAASIPVAGGDGLRLITAAVLEDTVEAGDEVNLDLYLSGGVEEDRRAPLRLALVDASGHEGTTKTYGFLRPNQTRTVFTVRRLIAVPIYLHPGRYQVVAQFGGPDDATTVVLGTVEVVRPEP